MKCRYDKLYMGNDVFFYNDKSGRVERLHATMDGPSAYNRSALQPPYPDHSANYHS